MKYVHLNSQLFEQILTAVGGRALPTDTLTAFTRDVSEDFANAADRNELQQMLHHKFEQTNAYLDLFEEDRLRNTQRSEAEMRQEANVGADIISVLDSIPMINIYTLETLVSMYQRLSQTMAP